MTMPLISSILYYGVGKDSASAVKLPGLEGGLYLGDEDRDFFNSVSSVADGDSLADITANLDLANGVAIVARL